MPASGKYRVIYVSLKLRLCAICDKPIIVIKILMPFFVAKQRIKVYMQSCHNISLSPDMKATMFYLKPYVLCKTKFRWAFYQPAVT